MVQKAAFGSKKNPEGYTIEEPMEIPVGQGIVGSVAQSGVAEIIADTSLDQRYVAAGENRLSEMAVPLLQHGRVIGIIDSEHSERGFYQAHHLEALKTIAAICVSKISQAKADKEAARGKEAQQQAAHLKRVDELKSRFFANISHEFRTPLNLILAPLENRTKEITGAEVGMMRRNAHRLLRLVNQLLDLARIEVGLVNKECRNIEVARFLAGIAETFSPLAATRGIRYQVNIPERDYVVGIDPDKLGEDPLQFCLSNAFKFTPAGRYRQCSFLPCPDRMSCR